MTAISNGSWNTVLTGSLSSITFSGATVLSGSYSAISTTVLSGAVVNFDQSYLTGDIDETANSTKLYSNLIVQPNGLLQATVSHNNTHKRVFIF